MAAATSKATSSSPPSSENVQPLEAEMRSALAKKDVNLVNSLIVEKKVNPNLEYDHTNGNKLLHFAAVDGDAQLVQCLIEAGASAKADNKFGETPVHYAARAANYETLSALLDKGGDAKTLLKTRTNEDKTPLDEAIDHKLVSNKVRQDCRQDCIKLLLKRGSKLDTTVKGKDNVPGKTALIRIMLLPEGPQILREALDDCIAVDNSERLKFDYSLLLTDEQPESGNNKNVESKSNLIQMQLLNELIEKVPIEKTTQLVAHPVVESFLHLKWLKIRLFFLLSVVFYLALIIGVTIYTLLVISSTANNKSDATTGSAVTPKEEDKGEEGVVTRKGNFIIDADLQLSLIVVIVAIIIQEAIQMSSYPLQYLRQTETWIKLMILVFSSILIAVEIPWPIWVHHLSVFTFIFGWAEITLLVSRFPIFGEYGLMFKLVIKQLVKFIFVFFFFLLGFALSFHVMFHQQNNNNRNDKEEDSEFSTPWISLLRTLSMMVGDTIDFEKYLMRKEFGLMFYGTVHVVYFCFLILVPMILINLIIGMAVTDIQALKNEGHVKQLRKQSTFIVDMEEAVCIICRWFRLFHSLKKCSDWLIDKISLKEISVELKDDNNNGASLPSGCLDRALAIKGLSEANASTNITPTDIHNLLNSVKEEISKRINELENNLVKEKTDDASTVQPITLHSH